MKLFRSNPCLLPIYLLLLLAPAATSWGGIPTEVTVNKSILLNLKNPAARVSIANPALAELILITPQQLQINGTAPGTTNLIVWEKGNDKPSFFDLKIMGDLGAMETQLKELVPNDAITMQYANDTIVLAGNTANEQTRKKAEEIAKAYSVKVINHIRIDEPQQVLLQVKVAQVDKTSLKKLGISYMAKGNTAEGFTNLIGAPVGGAIKSTTSSGNGFQTQETGSGVGISGNVVGLGSYNPLEAYQLGISYFPAGVGAVLNALTTKGLAKVLAEPNLLVKSGQDGKFHAGSEIPYSVVKSVGGVASTEIVFKQVGITLNFKPEVMENGIISLRIDPAEVSSISGTLAVNGYPIIDTRNVNTLVELKNGESLVLAGLLQEEAIKTMSKIPLLGDIPILGALFRSTQDDIKEKELVFFITPKIVKPMAPGEKAELPTDRKLTPEEERELKWMPLGE
ncbi:type II and III secretion system protein family protein [Geomobilimonas luticola]|uniref:Pilus assembly protein N-terminal domain-containing protein n=1 Tax=Geomobilimonas luticola TaxID=1114878 RepID=A0ABS5SC67_9BACT|nr:pilus assembly protein N-terminal domain-containing protein [Geomobilimonas luticola]MBT0652963.1 pilus assembly protein N-terminal domain-containing protein [Geomobilimonas luticola]